MIKPDEAVLKQLHQFKNTALPVWLEKSRQHVLEILGETTDAEERIRLQGDNRTLKELIEKIESARDVLNKQQGLSSRPEQKKHRI